MRQKSNCIGAIFILAAIELLSFSVLSCPITPAADRAGNDIKIINYVTWWSHDATGYHPAICFRYINRSGKDFTGQLIRFQARFLDLHNSYVTTARKEVRMDFGNFEEHNALMRGPTPFELSIDVNEWPPIECKLMCRIGDTGDIGTENLVIARLDNITMTDEEAMQKLVANSYRYPLVGETAHARESGNNHLPDRNEKPIAATPLSLADASLKSQTQNDALSEKKKDILEGKKATAKVMPPHLGNDFFAFEQAYGRPVETDATAGCWTVAHYHRNEPASELYVIARHPSSCADIIISVPAVREPLKDGEFLAGVSKLAGKTKLDSRATPVHSVRYLPAGRVAVTQLATGDYKFCLYSISAPDASRNQADEGREQEIVAAARLPGAAKGLEPVLEDLTRHSRILKFLPPVFSDAESK